MAAFVFILLACSFLAAQAVTLNNPFNKQLPNIARVNKPYSWTFAPDTFTTGNGVIQYSMGGIPQWLSFDAASLTLTGTPTNSDQGSPSMTVVAQDASSSATANLVLCVTDYPPPVLDIPIQQQFHSSNPSLSSVFLLSPGSAIATSNPALRIPPKWSFSIGFDGSTFDGSDSLFYAGLMSDGSQLPEWITFNPKLLTFNGVTPNVLGTQLLTLALHASDQAGYTASALLFDLVVAANELSIATSLPTINITASTPFHFSLSSPSDFSGLLVNDVAIQPSAILELAIDISAESWLEYDTTTRSLSGTPPGNFTSMRSLPISLTTIFNQTILTNISLAVVPSYFSTSMIQSVLVDETGGVDFSLAPYFSNATRDGPNDVNLTAAFVPASAGAFLSFDVGLGELKGSFPSNFADINSGATHITVTFTAYSYITHSTSHASVTLSLTPSNDNTQTIAKTGSISTASHTKLVLALCVAFGMLGGLLFLGIVFAALRRIVRTQDTAIDGRACRDAYTDGEKQWYGIGEDGRSVEEGRGYGWTEKIIAPSTPTRAPGLGFGHSVPRTLSNPLYSPRNLRSPESAVMRKKEFFGRMRETVRKVSDKYSRPRSLSFKAIIGKPMPSGENSADLPLAGIGNSNFLASGASSVVIYREDYSQLGRVETLQSTNTNLTSSTMSRPEPRRRGDLVVPRPSPLAQSGDALSQQESLGSDDHEEAVVQTATRATSLRSIKSASGTSYQSVYVDKAYAATTANRPRVVPFGAAHVPVPRLHEGDKPLHGLSGKRIASQRARVMMKRLSLPAEPESELDDLETAFTYVEALGDSAGAGVNLAATQTATSAFTVGTNMQSTYSSPPGSQFGQDTQRDEATLRVLVKVGEKFKYRVPMGANAYGRRLNIQSLSGAPLPLFMHTKMLAAVLGRRGVELSGEPGVDDVGLTHVGIYRVDNGQCLTQVIVEVAATKAGY